ncbi:MAG: alpha-ketoglutarate decarboxylase [Bacteroidetes bacterium]|nr:MAG: alpha-ketoglutarate decarboxylase [Bacteroidota bacterium]
MKTPIKSRLIFSFILVAITFNSFNSYSQEPQDSFWNNVRFGGGLGLSFGNGFFSGTIAPSAIYEFNNQLATGIGLNGTFAKQKNLYNSTILGASVITLFNPINELQLSAEFEELNVNRNFDENFVSNADDNYWFPALYLGAGYRTGNVTVGIRYDVLYNEDKSVFADPWMPFFRFYF